MRERRIADIMLHFTMHLLSRVLLFILISGIVILPVLLNRTVVEFVHIFVVVWITVMAILLLGSIAAKKAADTRITRRGLEISLVVLQKNLESAKGMQRQAVLQQMGEGSGHID